MQDTRDTTEKKVQHKVIYVFIACCMALGLAFTISKITFDQMLHTVDNITKPNEKLNMVTKISRDILQLDQLQRSQLLLSNQTTSSTDLSDFPSYIDDTKSILVNLDSLKSLYVNNPVQAQRVDSISSLLKERNKLFLSYIQVRKKLINNSTFNTQLRNINELIRTAPKTDTVLTTEKITKTTILNNVKKESPAAEKKDERGFFSKLLGINKSKEREASTANVPDRTVHEELSIQVDTLNQEPKRVAKAKINQAIKHLEAGQQLQSTTFNNRETELTIAGNILINHIIDILYEVEAEAKTQMDLDTRYAQMTVNKSVSKITYILLASFLITSVLIYLILNDIRKASRYRLALEKAKEEAEYHSAAKQRFLSNMSHELRTPLQSIIGYTEQLKNAKMADKNVDVIYHASEHLLQIVNELLDYNRIISGRFVFQQETVYLSTLVRDTVSTMQQHAEDKHLSLQVEEHIKGNGYVLGDPFRLKQILFNLVSNAIKFTTKGEIVVSLTVLTEGERTQVTFMVTDTGQGIADDEKETIFNEFEQGNHHNSGENFGSGLGLSIVKSLVEEMGGEITLSSQPSIGSCFSVHLSLLSSEKVMLLPKSKEKLLLDQHIGTVWIVDDDAFILELCSTILSNKHIPHRLFSTPQALLDAPFDADVTHILMDMRMPGLSGKELKHIVKQRIPASVKIIAFTAQALPEERSSILAEGFDGLLVKPFREAELLEILGVVPTEDTGRFSKEFDLGILPFIYEDPNELLKIIDLFIKDTQNDLASLKRAILENNAVDTEIISHRLAGRSAQLGQEKIAFNLRKCEIDARSGDIPPLSEFHKIEKQLIYFMEFLTQKDKVIL